jgi:hypothetical protein
MASPDASWLFVLTDGANKSDASAFLPSIVEGQNVAFLFNTSDSMINESTPNLLSCMARTVLDTYARSLYGALRAEEERYFQTTEEEWIRSRPSGGDRNNNVFRSFKVKRWMILLSLSSFE